MILEVELHLFFADSPCLVTLAVERVEQTLYDDIKINPV